MTQSTNWIELTAAGFSGFRVRVGDARVTGLPAAVAHSGRIHAHDPQETQKSDPRRRLS
jgi:hypothetical protein